MKLNTESNILMLFLSGDNRVIQSETLLLWKPTIHVDPI